MNVRLTDQSETITSTWDNDVVGEVICSQDPNQSFEVIWFIDQAEQKFHEVNLT